MGDRGNIVMDFGKEGKIYLYGHWVGSELPDILQNALASKEGRGRWSDGAYLTRIIFNHLQGNDRGETGFGIAPYPCDNEHSFMVVDLERQTVTVQPDDSRSWTKNDNAGKSWSFSDYVNLKELPRI